MPHLKGIGMEQRHPHGRIGLAILPDRAPLSIPFLLKMIFIRPLALVSVLEEHHSWNSYSNFAYAVLVCFRAGIRQACGNAAFTQENAAQHAKAVCLGGRKIY
jgi:hypothetical protein